MISKEFIDSLILEKQKGLTNESLRTALRKLNWTEEDIEKAVVASGEEKIGYEYTPQKINFKQILTIVLLVIIYPVGLLIMWLWMKKWGLVVKWLVTMVFMTLTVLIYLLSPINQFDKNQINNYENSIINNSNLFTQIIYKNFPTVYQALNPTTPAYYPYYSFTPNDEKRLETGLSSDNPAIYLPIIAPSLRSSLGKYYTLESDGIFVPGSTVTLIPKTLNLRDNGKNMYGSIQALVTTSWTSSKYVIGLIKENGVWYITYRTSLGK